MNIRQSITKTASVIASVLVAFGLLASTASAQVTGTNGRVLWTSPLSGQITAKSDGSNINQTGLATITGGGGQDWQAVYTPSGGYIVSMGVATSGAAANIYVTNSTHTITPVPITTFTTCNVGDPAVSPNGQKVAFTCESAGPTTEVYVIDLNISGNSISGSNQIQLTNQIASASTYNPVWAADSSVIYVRNGTDILSISPTTASQTTGTSVYAVGASFVLDDVTPTGTTLLYQRVPTGLTNRQLFTVTTGGASNAQLTTDNNADYVGGYYSPDGTKIVTAKFPTSPSDQQITTMNANGSSEAVIYSLTASSGVGVQQYRPYWSTSQDTFSSGGDSGGTTPGVPNTAGAAHFSSHVSTNPWPIGISILAVMILLGSGAYWLKLELAKNKK